ncbi:hypothetical protein BT67DRAFT_286909 [Trichocladium antarcticum]|uniref:Uncharacterized protein n=1 Tax=Trichocladium antarcticum TaxID=1450529 RepID=A0AAN6ULG4_9PEZI|nr:hypothetical protein BT67DRAFT_286909 [Trichocladium antarcticum]
MAVAFSIPKFSSSYLVAVGIGKMHGVVRPVNQLTGQRFIQGCRRKVGVDYLFILTWCALPACRLGD